MDREPHALIAPYNKGSLLPASPMSHGLAINLRASDYTYYTGKLMSAVQ